MKARKAVLLFVICGFILSCKKNTDPTPAPVTKPRVGTTWTYRYKTFDGGGTVATSYNIVYKASSSQTLGGEQWLNITDSANATVFLLNTKTGGLYQYANSTANLLCKDPAVLNDTYNTYNAGSTQTFTVAEVGVILNVPYDDVRVNRYDGVKTGNLTDQVWYNSDLWIVKMEKFIPNPFTGVYHRDKRWELYAITY